MTDKIISEAVFRQKYLSNRHVIVGNQSINLAKQKKVKYLTVPVHSKKDGIFDIIHIKVELDYSLNG
jgi:hypothetical protein